MVTDPSCTAGTGPSHTADTGPVSTADTDPPSATVSSVQHEPHAAGS